MKTIPLSFGDTENRYTAILREISLSENRDELLDIIERIVKLERK